MKKVIGHPTSDTREQLKVQAKFRVGKERNLQPRMIVWQIIRRLATIAQKTPAGWLGTELPLEKVQ